jgi:hypothetical protein
MSGNPGSFKLKDPGPLYQSFGAPAEVMINA